MSKNYLNRRNVGYEPIGNSIGGDPRQSRTRRVFDPVSAAISVGGNLIGGAMSADAASSAAKKQSKAALQAAQMQQQTASGQIQYMQQLRDQQIRELQAGQQSGILGAQQGNQAAQAQLESLRNQQLNTLSQNYGMNQQQQADIYNQGMNTVGGVYNTSMANLQPYMQTGEQGATTLAGMIPQLSKSFTAEDLKSNLSPNYEFMKEQGLGALGQSMNVGGGGSNMTRSATKFAEDYASNAYQNAFNNWQQQQNNIYNRLSGIAGIGTTATGQGVNAGGQYTGAATSLGNSYGGNLANLGINYGQQTNAANLGFGQMQANTGLGYNQIAAQQGLGYGQAMSQFNQGMGTNIANLATGGAAAGAAGLTGSAAAQAAGQVGSTNAMTGALGNATNTYLLSSLMNPQSTMASPTGGFNF